MTVVLVEGVSDAAALETLAWRMRVPPPRIVAVGGSKGARRAAAGLVGERLLGLVDRAERADFAGIVDELFVCDPDLEAELVRALGADGVLAIIEQQGEGRSFEVLQRQPAQRGRALEQQLIQFFAGRSGNKVRYARLLADAVQLDRVPEPLAALLAAAEMGGPPRARLGA
jgi:hypothetical protein